MQFIPLLFRSFPRAPARHHPVADDALLLHAEVLAAVGHEGADLDERPRIEQQLDPLARGEASLLVLLGDALLAAAGQRVLTSTAQLGQALLSVQGDLLEMVFGAREGRERSGSGQATQDPPIFGTSPAPASVRVVCRDRQEES